MTDEIGRVTILAVGVWQYQHMRQLTGPEKDLRNLRDILVDDPDIAIFERRQFHELLNPTSEELRRAINEFIFERSAENDILLFYFSGHGAQVGSSDFAFCTVDTTPMPEEHIILPMTAVSFTEILRSLWIKKVIPIVVIDACYSGLAGGALIVSIGQLVEELKGEIQRKYASTYALLCSAPSDEEVRDNPQGDGGFFSSTLANLAREGIDPNDRRVPTITLTRIFPFLWRAAEASALSPIPMLFIGPTLPEFSIVKNVCFEALEYRLQPHLVAVLRALWNNGEPRELRPRDILAITGLNGAYGNHQKLSFYAWSLVETTGNRRRLTERGIAFMQGRLTVPRDVVLDNQRKIYVAKTGTEMVGIDSFPE